MPSRSTCHIDPKQCACLTRFWIHGKNRLVDARGCEGAGEAASGGEPIFSQPIRARHRAIEIDHRSARSRCRWRKSSSIIIIIITGWRGGGPRPTEIGGVIQPCRTASTNRASDHPELRVGLGGPISATTRSRSVTRTVSPPAASRTLLPQLILERFEANGAHGLRS